jgi:hypothetical protein
MESSRSPRDEANPPSSAPNRERAFSPDRSHILRLGHTEPRPLRGDLTADGVAAIERTVPKEVAAGDRYDARQRAILYGERNQA